MYSAIRANARSTGIGELALERMLDCPVEHLRFHLWYMKEKGWIRKTESGMFAITVEGVDRANSEPHRETATNRLLTDRTVLHSAAEEAA